MAPDNDQWWQIGIRATGKIPSFTFQLQEWRVYKWMWSLARKGTLFHCCGKKCLMPKHFLKKVLQWNIRGSIINNNQLFWLSEKQNLLQTHLEAERQKKWNLVFHPSLFFWALQQRCYCKENRPLCALGFKNQGSSQLSCSFPPSTNEEINSNFGVRW